MSDVLANPMTVFWGAIALMVVVPSLAHYWRKVRRDELDAELKQEMVRRGMSADEIIRVLQAARDPRSDD